MKPYLLALLLAGCAPVVQSHVHMTTFESSDRAVYKKGLATLVDVVCWSDKGTYSFGSGSVVGEDSEGHQLVLTAAHVLKYEILMVKVSDDEAWEKESYVSDAEVVKKDTTLDVALIRLGRKLPREIVKIGPPPEQADPVFYFGNADEAPTTFGRGILTRTHYPGTRHDWYQFQGFVWPGMSGGPVLNDRGQIIGIVVAVNVVDDPTTEGAKVVVPDTGYMIPEPVIAKFLLQNGVK